MGFLCQIVISEMRLMRQQFTDIQKAFDMPLYTLVTVCVYPSRSKWLPFHLQVSQDLEAKTDNEIR